MVTRNCDNCNKEYKARQADLNRGWSKCCSKSCAASKREKSKPGYNPARVAKNNIRRANWGTKYPRVTPPTVVGGAGEFQGYTSEGYRIFDGIAYDEFDDPVYDVNPFDDDPGDYMYWDEKDY